MIIIIFPLFYLDWPIIQNFLPTFVKSLCVLKGPNIMEKELDEKNVPTLDGWKDVALFAVDQMNDAKDWLVGGIEETEELLAATRSNSDWPWEGRNVFEETEPDDATEEEIEAYAARIQDKWSEAKALLLQAKGLIDQAKACMDEFKNE